MAKSKLKIKLNKAEIISKRSRLDIAEQLIKQLPFGHEGAMTWLLNYGKGKEGKKLRKNAGIKFDKSTQSAELRKGCQAEIVSQVPWCIAVLEEMFKTSPFAFPGYSEKDRETIKELVKEEIIQPTSKIQAEQPQFYFLKDTQNTMIVIKDPLPAEKVEDGSFYGTVVHSQESPEEVGRYLKFSESRFEVKDTQFEVLVKNKQE